MANLEKGWMFGGLVILSIVVFLFVHHLVFPCRLTRLVFKLYIFLAIIMQFFALT